MRYRKENFNTRRKKTTNNTTFTFYHVHTTSVDCTVHADIHIHQLFHLVVAVVAAVVETVEEEQRQEDKSLAVGWDEERWEVVDIQEHQGAMQVHLQLPAE